jgi:hypothetical protein
MAKRDVPEFALSAYDRRVEVRFPANLHEALLKQARGLNVGVSGIIRQAALEWLRRQGRRKSPGSPHRAFGPR